MLSKQERLNRLKQRISSGPQLTINTEFYFLAKELGCLADLLGREYEVEYEGDKIKRIIQKPMAIPSFIKLIEELEKDYKNQEKQMKKANRKGRK